MCKPGSKKCDTCEARDGCYPEMSDEYEAWEKSHNAKIPICCDLPMAPEERCGIYICTTCGEVEPMGVCGSMVCPAQAFRNAFDRWAATLIEDSLAPTSSILEYMRREGVDELVFFF